jgi:hypothetical protein
MKHLWNCLVEILNQPLGFSARIPSIEPTSHVGSTASQRLVRITRSRTQKQEKHLAVIDLEDYKDAMTKLEHQLEKFPIALHTENSVESPLFMGSEEAIQVFNLFSKLNSVVSADHEKDGERRKEKCSPRENLKDQVARHIRKRVWSSGILMRNVRENSHLFLPDRRTLELPPMEKAMEISAAVIEDMTLDIDSTVLNREDYRDIGLDPEGEVNLLLRAIYLIWVESFTQVVSQIMKNSEDWQRNHREHGMSALTQIEGLVRVRRQTVNQELDRFSLHQTISISQEWDQHAMGLIKQKLRLYPGGIQNDSS